MAEAENTIVEIDNSSNPESDNFLPNILISEREKENDLESTSW